MTYQNFTIKQAMKVLLNKMLDSVGVRLVNANWGPRGFIPVLEQMLRAGIYPRQIVDVGAARGEWTKQCMHVFPASKYLLIDPIYDNMVFLDALQKQAENVKVWSGALGAEKRKLSFNVHGDQSSFFYSKEWTGEKREIEMRKLDSFLEAGKIQPPDLIKADVQGYELEVLKGGINCLKTAQIVLLEVSFVRLYEKAPLAHEVIDFMGCHGFRIYDICSYVQRPWDGQLTQSDIFFVKSDSIVFSYNGWARNAEKCRR